MVSCAPDPVARAVTSIYVHVVCTLHFVACLLFDSEDIVPSVLPVALPRRSMAL